ASKVSSAKPRLQPGLVEEITRFSGGRVRALAKSPPGSHLQGSPEQNISFADTDIGHIDVVAADCRGVDFSMIPGADGKRAVIRFRHVTPITIVRGEQTSLAITERSKAFGQCAVDDFDIQFLHALDLEYTFGWKGCHNCNVRSRHAAREVHSIQAAL